MIIESRSTPEDETPLKFHLKSTDSEEEVRQKLSGASDDKLMELYQHVQTNLAMRSVQRNKKAEQLEEVKKQIGDKPSFDDKITIGAEEYKVGKQQDEIGLGFALVGLLRNEMKRRGMELPPTMEERGL